MTADAAQDFRRLPDLASRRPGGSVVFANDELFAERENLINPETPSHSTYTFGHRPAGIVRASSTPHSSRATIRAGNDEVSTVRLDVYPDGGMARVRLYGELSEPGRARLGVRWLNSLPAAHAGQVLDQDRGLDRATVDRALESRPVADLGGLPDPVRRLLGGAP